MGNKKSRKNDHLPPPPPPRRKGQDVVRPDEVTQGLMPAAPPPPPPATLPPPPRPDAVVHAPPAPQELPPGVLWQGERRSATTEMVGMVRARYQITADYLIFEAGLLSSVEELVPMWALRDIDVRVSATQKMRSVGDVIVGVEPNAYTGRHEVRIEHIADPKAVRDLLLRLSSEARHRQHDRARTQTIRHEHSGISPAPPPPNVNVGVQANGPVDIAGQLEKLADLRDRGVLSDEEFAIQKARLLG